VDEGIFVFGRRTEDKRPRVKPWPTIFCPWSKEKKEARMKKITAKIKNIWRKAISLRVPDVLPALAGLLDTRAALRPIPVRAERIYRRK
jgi:hypothetical protein